MNSNAAPISRAALLFSRGVRVHRSLKMTPAMAAGVIDELWTIEDLYDAVMMD